jgi:vancomycin permeability regulator SanA
LICLTAAICLGTCKPIKQGTVTEKRYLPPRTLYANGVYNQTEARYRLVIEDNSLHQKNKKQVIFVSKQMYDSLMVGDLFSIR